MVLGINNKYLIITCHECAHYIQDMIGDIAKSATFTCEKCGSDLSEQVDKLKKEVLNVKEKTNSLVEKEKNLEQK